MALIYSCYGHSSCNRHSLECLKAAQCCEDRKPIPIGTVKYSSQLIRNHRDAHENWWFKVG